MDKYYISIKQNKENHAGFKAVFDSEMIFEKLGYSKILINEITIKKVPNLRKLSKIFSLLWNILRVKKNSVIIWSYPQFTPLFYKYIKYFFRIVKKKKCINILLIHDIVSIRKKELNINLKQNEQSVFFMFDYIISHNKSMTKYLVTECNISLDRIVNLELFDYLIESKEVNYEKQKESTIVVAGNLAIEKSGYIYKLANILKKFSLNAYGPNCQQEKFSGSYKGSFLPEEIPSVLSGKYGLVWDGESLDSCKGDYGNYLKYNNPHKVSLYLVSGLPIIIWKQAALAELIERENLGLVVDNLYELEDKILSVNEKEYQVILNNVEKYRKRLLKGEFLQSAIEKVERRIEQDKYSKIGK